VILQIKVLQLRCLYFPLLFEIHRKIILLLFSYLISYFRVFVYSNEFLCNNKEYFRMSMLECVLLTLLFIYFQSISLPVDATREDDI